jgi:glycosyltransferase involved in cell wall biosynthesis/tetratricopeptide (TPR) repeat protein
MALLDPDSRARDGADPFIAAAQLARTIDPVETVLAAALAPPRRLTATEAVAEADRLLTAARRDAAHRVTLPDLLALVAAAPHVEPVQHAVAELLGLAGDRLAAFICWRGIVARFPLSGEAWRRMLLAAAAAEGREFAAFLFRLRFADRPRVEQADHAVFAQGCEAIGRLDDAEDSYRALTIARPGDPLAWLRLAELRRTRGSLAEARDILRDAANATAASEVRAALRDAEATIASLAADIPGERLAQAPTWEVALDHLLHRLVAERCAAPPPMGRDIGGIVLLGATLGGGGAERQLVATALALGSAIDAGRRIGNARVLGPVSILCRRLDARHAHDFFLPRLAAAGIPVAAYLGSRPFGGARAASVVSRDAAVVEQLPTRMREGLLHLADLLRLRAPDVVHIWQDGMILAAGLAALMARVPHIVLNVRTLPPTDRADRLEPGQRALYRGLLSAPGVTLTANSAIAARRYEEWLDLPAGSTIVVPNGVAPLAAQGDDADEILWSIFSEQAGPGFTMGGVMRLDGNKRPLDWLGVADALARRVPDARFVLVGDGRLRREVEELAAHRGLLDRLLLVGRSAHVGYWLSRMDALVLTSRFEGTPNVLIEAQAAGLPVVTTPAGGAAETLIPGITGTVLAEAEVVDADAAAAALARYAAATPDERAHRAALARAWAHRRYSLETMLDTTLAVFAAPPACPTLRSIDTDGPRSAA